MSGALKRYLANQAAVRTLGQLQGQLDAFAHYYNTTRPHRALGGRTPLQAYGARVKARPASAGGPDAHFRIRHDKVDSGGTVTLRHDSKLHHIGIGRAHKGKPVKLLIADRDIRVLDLHTGELIRHLTSIRVATTSRSEGLRCLRCPGTSVSDVPGHNTKRLMGFEPSF